MTAPDTQLVGESLTLKCSATTVRGISSRVDIIWRSNGIILAKTEGVSVSLTENNSALYVDIYEIPLLTTAEDGRTYQCEIMINQEPPLISEAFTTLNVTGNLL